MNFLGLDVGTTRMKCGVFDEHGNMIYTDAVDYGERQTGEEKYIDADGILSSCLALLGRAYAACPYDTVAVSSLGESFVLLDRENRVLFYPMLYTDTRGEAEADDMMKYADRFFEISGVCPQSMYSAYKLRWIAKNRPDLYEKADKALLINEYITYCLSGVRGIDYAQSARTGVFDIRKKEFSRELCDLLGIDIRLFSPPIPSGRTLGKLREELARAWGVSGDVFIVSGGHDQICATLGSGAFESGWCSDGMGTVECLTVVYDQPSADTEMGRCGYPNVPFLENGYATYLLNYSCGSLTRWWLRNCHTEEEIRSGVAFADAEKDFTDTPTGLLTLPYFDGASTPYQNINATGAILNLRLTDSSSRVYQGILEGLCYEMKLNLDVVEKFGIRPAKLIATGGGSASKKWLQMKADILGIPVYPLENAEAGVCGAAMLGAHALTGKSFGELTKTFVRFREAIEPRPTVTEAYATQYAKYKNLYKTLKEYM